MAIIRGSASQAQARRNFRRYLASKVKPDVLGSLHDKICDSPNRIFSIAARIPRAQFIALKSA